MHGFFSFKHLELHLEKYQFHPLTNLNMKKTSIKNSSKSFTKNQIEN